MFAMTMGTLRGIITGVLLVLFVWLVAWAWSRGRATTFEAAARAPLEEDQVEDDQEGTTP